MDKNTGKVGEFFQSGNVGIIRELSVIKYFK